MARPRKTDTDLRHGRHCVFALHVHLVFVTKYRRNVFKKEHLDAMQAILASEQSERVVGMAKLVGQVQAMIERSGDPTDFNAAQWVAQWLEQPSQALGGQRPAELMDTVAGQEVVSDLVAKMQSGAYA